MLIENCEPSLRRDWPAKSSAGHRVQRTEETTLERARAGMDIGEEHHHVVVIDADGARLLSRRVRSDETALLELIGQVAELADEVHWAMDLVTSESALLLTLLSAHQQRVFYISGSQVNSAAGSYRGAGKTDTKDAAIIADQARMRRDLTPLRVDDELIVELRMLLARRRDLAGDRVRLVNRLHQQLLGISPALERALDLITKGPLVLLTGYQTPEAQPAPAAAIPPRAAARPLHLGADQHPMQRAIANLPRPQEIRGETAYPGRSRPRPQASQRLVGAAA